MTGTNEPLRRTGTYKLTTETFVAIDPMIGMKGITPYTFLEDVD